MSVWLKKHLYIQFIPALRAARGHTIWWIRRKTRQLVILISFAVSRLSCIIPLTPVKLLALRLKMSFAASLLAFDPFFLSPCLTLRRAHQWDRSLLHIDYLILMEKCSLPLLFPFLSGLCLVLSLLTFFFLFGLWGFLFLLSAPHDCFHPI